MGLNVDNPQTPREYHEVDETVTTHTQVANNNWEDWDLSAFVGAVAFDIKGGAGANPHGVRQNGTAIVRLHNAFAPTLIAVPDAAGIVETYSITGAVFALHGYWT